MHPISFNGKLSPINENDGELVLRILRMFVGLSLHSHKATMSVL